jgi:prefoldin subunit 5
MMGAVQNAKAAVSGLIKKMDERIEELNKSIQSLEQHVAAATTQFKDSSSGLDGLISGSLGSSIQQFQNAIRAVEQSKAELSKCRDML